jgi:hypothetical protein
VWKAVARVDAPVEILVARRGVLTRCTARPQRGRGNAVLEIDADATPVQRQLREAWLDPNGNDSASQTTV